MTFTPMHGLLIALGAGISGWLSFRYLRRKEEQALRRMLAETTLADLTNPGHTAYWAYRGWCMGCQLHHTEVWHPTEVQKFLALWNAIPAAVRIIEAEDNA